MKPVRVWMLVSTLAAAMALGPITSWTRADDAAPKGGKSESLEKDMSRMGRALRKLTAQVKDPAQNASSLALLAEMEKACIDAKDLTPALAATQPADKRANFISDYRAMMVNLLRDFLDLEELLVDGKNDKAPDAIKTIVEAMKEGHKEFRKPEKDEEHEGGGHHKD
jgi:hypothetical protein